MTLDIPHMVASALIIGGVVYAVNHVPPFETMT